MENERYPYWPMSERPVIRWPDGKKLAFWVIPNIEHFRMTPDELRQSESSGVARIKISMGFGQAKPRIFLKGKLRKFNIWRSVSIVHSA